MADEKKKEAVINENEKVEGEATKVEVDVQPEADLEQPKESPDEVVESSTKKMVTPESKAPKKKPEKVKKEKTPKEPKKVKEDVPAIRKKLMLEPEEGIIEPKGTQVLILVAIFAILFGALGIVVQYLELLATMDLYTIGVAGLLLITGILFVIPMNAKVKHVIVIVSFVYYILGILAGVAAWYFLTYTYVEAALVSVPFVVPFIVTIIYFVKHSDKKVAEVVEEDLPLIDEKLVLEEEKGIKIKAPRKVKPTKYKESNEVGEKLFKNRIKYTNKIFKHLKAKAKGQIDVLIKKDYFEAQKRAKSLLGINEKDYYQQVLITVPDSFSNRDEVKYHLEVEKDGENKLYFDQAYVTILYYGKETLFIYQCNIDHRSGYIGHDRAQEFNYFDVISVETSIKFDNDTRPKYSVLNAELTLSNNQKFLIHLRNQRLDSQPLEQPLLSEKEQNVLQMLKERIRASKV